MGTSTGELNTERPESGPGELIVTMENNTNDGGEITANALPTGKIFFYELCK